MRCALKLTERERERPRNVPSSILLRRTHVEGGLFSERLDRARALAEEVKQLEQVRRQDYGMLAQQVRSLKETNEQLRGETARQKPHAHMMWEFHGYGGQQAVRLGDCKGVRQKLHQGVTKTELCDLKTDEAEKNDVAEKHPDVVKRIEEILRTDRVPSKLFPIKALD